MPVTRVINLTDHSQTVSIVNADTKEVREIFVQPSGRPKLPDGFAVEPVFLFRNPGFQVVTEGATAPDAAEEPQA